MSAPFNRKDSIIKSWVYPDIHIPIKSRRGYLTPPHGASQMTTGTYTYTLYSNRIEHQVFANLPNPEGGWTIHGEKQTKFYRVWLTDGESYHKVGDLKRVLTGEYTYKADSLPKEIGMNLLTVISLEENKSATKPTREIIMQGLLND